MYFRGFFGFLVLYCLVRFFLFNYIDFNIYKILEFIDKVGLILCLVRSFCYIFFYNDMGICFIINMDSYLRVFILNI